MLAPGTSIGRYLVKQKLAEGGMAEIYLASAIGVEGFAKDVVIKVVHRFLGTDDQFVQMFITEARLASRLNHANIVQIFDFGKHEERYFLAMEYVRGVSLAALQQRGRRLRTRTAVPATLAAEICAQVARGLQYAHVLSEGGRPLGVVHRDVTPHNVLLSFDGAVKLSDFGIAKATTTHTAPGMLKGKFAYMSPEQSRGDRVDARSDVFSLGIVLWEMLTGLRLFSGDSDVSVLRAVQSAPIADPGQLNADVPEELSEVVMKALTRPVEKRFQSALEAERALATFVLHNAQTVDDTSVSHFLLRLYPRDFDPDVTMKPSPEPPSDFVDRPGPAPGTATLTPSGQVPARASPRPGEPSEDASLGHEEVKRGTEPVSRPKRSSTAPMPKLGSPSSRRLARFPPVEPSLVVEPRAEAQAPEWPDAEEEARSLEEDLLAVRPRRRLAIYTVGGLATLAIAAGAVAFAVSSVRPSGAPRSASAPVEGRAAPGEASRGGAPAVQRPVQPEVTPLAEKTDRPPVEAAPLAPPAEFPVTEPLPAANRTATKPPVGVAARPVARMGRLTVKVIPFGVVTADGRELGEAFGTQTYQLKAGTYEIGVAHPRKRMRKTITITPNEEVRLEFNALE